MKTLKLDKCQFKRNQVLLGLVILLWISCNNTERKVESSFYYWKQSFGLTHTEQTYLKELEVKKIYIRFFDIKWSKVTNNPYIVAPISFKNTVPSTFHIIPTVYITNNTISNCPEKLIKDLAKLIINNIKEAALSQNIPIKGIQIDCDWSLSTKDKYFQLLQSIRNSMPKGELSATIRLHQVKFYKKTGIPPVDRGTLMFYNMDAVTDSTTNNSILDLEIAQQYFYNFDEYTIPLDVALPLFKWGVIRRRGKVVQLIKDELNYLNYEGAYTSFQLPGIFFESFSKIGKTEEAVKLIKAAVEGLQKTLEARKSQTSENDFAFVVHSRPVRGMETVMTEKLSYTQMNEKFEGLIKSISRNK